MLMKYYIMNLSFYKKTLVRKNNNNIELVNPLPCYYIAQYDMHFLTFLYLTNFFAWRYFLFFLGP